MNQNQVTEQNEIIYTEVVSGDYNDVYSRQTVKGTWTQVEQYVRDQFSEEGLEHAQDISTDQGYGLAVYFGWNNDENEGDTMTEGDDRIEYFVDANPIEPEEGEEVTDLGVKA